MAIQKNALREAAEFEPPKLTIDLAKIFGFAPVSIEIPLPKIANPFAEKKQDHFALPFSKWRAWLRGWLDGGKGLPDTPQQLSAFEQEIEEQYKKKITEIERNIHEHRLAISDSINKAETLTFNADDAIQQVKNRLLDWMESYQHEILLSKEYERKAEQRKSELESSLDSLIKDAKLPSKIPKFNKSFLDKWSEIIFIAFIDIVLSFWMVSGKKSLAYVQALGISSMVSFVNIFIGLLIGQQCLFKAIHSSSRNGKIVFYSLSGIFGVLGIIANIKLAFWRDEDVYQSVISNGVIPFSAFGFILLVLGIVIITVAAFKGFYDLVRVILDTKKNGEIIVI